MVICWCALFSCRFVFPSSKSHVVWLSWRVGRYYRWWCAVLPLISGTTAPQHGTTAEGRDHGLYRGRGRFLLPHTHSSPPLSSSSLQPQLAVGGLRRISVSGASLSISFGGVDPHPVLLPWMPVLPPFLLSFCLVFRSCFLGAMVVASLDFWLNLGLSWLEKATRLSRLEFGRIIFEFGRPVVPDLTMVVGTRCFTASCYMKLLFLRLKQYSRSSWSGTTA